MEATYEKSGEKVSLLNGDVKIQIQTPEKVGGLNILTTCVFIVGLIAGSGFLTLPKAVDDAGWIGFVMILACCITSAYTGYILGQCWLMVMDIRPEFKSGLVRYPYPAIAQEAYGNVGRYVVSFSITFTLFGGTIVYVLLSAENISSLLGHHFEDGFCYIVLIIGAVMTPLTWLGTPKDFWGIAVAASLATGTASLILMASVIHYGTEISTVEHTDVGFVSFFTAYGTICFAYNGHPAFPTFQSDMKNPNNFGKAVMLSYGTYGTICFAYNGHPAFPTFQSDMKNPNNFGKAVMLSYGIVLLMYLPSTTAAYFVYGDQVKPNILNTILDVVLLMYLPSTSAAYFVYGDQVKPNILNTIPDGVTSNIVSVLMTVHLLFGIVIVINPVSQELEHALNVPENWTWKRLVTRTLMMILVLFVAESVPHFSSILSLVGGSTISILVFISPPLCYIKLCKLTKRSIPFHVKIFLYEIVFIGLVAGVATTYSAIVDLAKNKMTVPCYVDHIRAWNKTA